MPTTSVPSESSIGSVDQVASMLVSLITIGEFTPGEQLRQEDLAERLNVSRVPIREALHALSELGLLSHARHRGFFVTKRSRHELTQLARLLEILETELIKSIEWPSADQVAHLRELNAAMAERATSPDWVELIDLNQKFHFEIFELSPQGMILSEVKRLWRLASPYIVFDLSAEADRVQTITEHAALLDALECRDMEKAISVLDHHRSKTGLPAS